MPLLLIGVLIGMPLGVIAYFKLAEHANEAGRREATRINNARSIYPH